MENLRSHLTNAVAHRGRYYQAIFPISMIWKEDDTNAAADMKHFCNMMSLLNLPKPKEWIISSKQPAWEVAGWIHELIGALITAATTGHVLLIFHYAGHGAIHDRGGLFFAPNPNSQRRVFWSKFASSIGFEEEMNKVDVVTILDCCYSGLATRGGEQPDRSVEIVAALQTDQLDLGNGSYNIRVKNNTVTSRLASEAALAIGRGATSISMSELVAVLRDKTADKSRMCDYNLNLGGKGIRIPHLGKQSAPPHIVAGCLTSSSEDSGVTLSLYPSMTRVIFKVQIKHLGTNTEAQNSCAKFLEWIDQLDTSSGLEILGIYGIDSYVLIFQAPSTTWLRLKGLSNFSWLADVGNGTNYLNLLSPKPTQQVAKI